MIAVAAPVLLLPGYGDSGPAHWQSRWEQQQGHRRVVQADWQRPRLSDWLQPLEQAIAASASPPLLVAHSLGCLLVAHWARRHTAAVQGALLVAVPDPDSPRFPDEAASFRDVPLRPLPFPSLVVASDDDPYGSPAHAQRCAQAWGSRLLRIGARGHINADSGLGDWEQGLGLLGQL